ncbi:hypothetical protein DXD91_16890 [Anaerobutyricum hallii]|uniref:Transposase n=1 Tax=Anaerobutyricum hallii TaxID=39488 RepID=A0A374MJQ1_9FIRM|nr:hypothetical protein DXD91_16890 [Anaerobutyricum hallii]
MKELLKNMIILFTDMVLKELRLILEEMNCFTTICDENRKKPVKLKKISYMCQRNELFYNNL